MITQAPPALLLSVLHKRARVIFLKCKSDHVVPLFKILSAFSLFLFFCLKSKSIIFKTYPDTLYLPLVSYGIRLSVILWRTERECGWNISIVLSFNTCLKYYPLSPFLVNTYSSFRTQPKHYFFKKPSMMPQTKSYPTLLNSFLHSTFSQFETLLSFTIINVYLPPLDNSFIIKVCTYKIFALHFISCT